MITLMGKFNFIIGTKRVESEILRSKKGFQLVTYLIANIDTSVPLSALYGVMWPEYAAGSPENALKTQISRVRAMFDRFTPGLGEVIANTRGGYCWRRSDNISIDLCEVKDLLARIRDYGDDSIIPLGKRLSRLYKGDLLGGYHCEWARDEAASIREGYMSAMSRLIAVFKKRGEYDEIIRLCREGLENDAFNDVFHTELMNALAQSDRATEALDQYKHAVDLHCRYRKEQPSDALQRSYKRLAHAGGSLDVGLMKVMRDLGEHSATCGAFLCEYSVFREVYGLQMRNLERLGKSIFLSVIMICDIDGNPLQPLLQSEVMRGCLSILSRNLRRGDTITQISPTLLAMLLPSVDFMTGNAVLERIKSAFYLKYPNSGIVFSFKLSPLEDKSANGGAKNV